MIDNKIRRTDVAMSDVTNAYYSCRKRKRRTRQEQEFSIFVSSSIINLRNDILFENYKPMPIRSFLIDNPVLREIFAPEFRDRVDQHLIAEKLEPLFEKEFINDCYSCRKGRGTLFGVKRLRRFIAQCSRNYTRDCYILSCDIKGYFMSIVRKCLWERLEAFIREKYKGEDLEKLLWQTRTFLFSSPLNHTIVKGHRSRWARLPDNKSVFACCGAPKPNAFRGTYTADMDIHQKGLTIGALPSQMFGNFYLTPFDHFCKHELKLRFYGRYVDDFFVVHTDKAFLKKLVHILRAFLKSMGLSLHPDKIRIIHYKQGVPFLGVYIKGPVLLPGKRMRGAFRSLLDEIQKLDRMANYSPDIMKYESRLNSYFGMMRHMNAHKYMRRMVERTPRFKWFFHIDRHWEKVTADWRIRNLQYYKVRNIANKKYHEQFRRREQMRYRTRRQLYNETYMGLYGIMPQ